MNGLLLVDKDKGFTSFDVVAITRKLTSQKKIGHTGTLDPNATGVLPLLLGNATKAQDIIPNHDKEYVAGFKLGLTSDTLDIWGEIKSEVKSEVTLSELEKVLKRFRGEIEQIPPMYSAVSVDGKRLYDLARKGIEVERKSRKITVYELELLDFDENNQSGVLKVFCSKGTYIRTLIDDIGNVLGVGAVMTSLDRTKACGFLKEQCLPLEKLKKLSPAEIEEKLISTENLFVSFPELTVSEAQAKRFSNGGALDISRTALRSAENIEGNIYRIKYDDKFFGLGIVRDNEIKIYKHF
ncbi:MAG: tRNA pseudouridine(55) synthase TruB [Ruminococcus sp.]|nr:tRNA pseudouridine(55) synthase TruB [Ruminococcus sp.]